MRFTLFRFVVSFVPSFGVHPILLTGLSEPLVTLELTEVSALAKVMITKISSSS
jgi:hypothetical protein